MKKFLLTAGIFSAFLLFSCDEFKDIEMPETVSIKSKASYELSVGNLDFTLKDKLSIGDIKEKISGATIYDYNPTQNEDDVLQYIIDYPIKEIPISIEQDPDLGSITFDTNFDLPNLTENIQKTMTVDDQEFTAPEGVSGKLSDICDTNPSVYFNITAPEFDTMTLKSGKIKVKFVLEEGNGSKTIKNGVEFNDDFQMLVTLKLVEKDNTSNVISTSEEVDCADGGTLELDLKDKSIVPNMLILIDGSASGGTASETNKYKVTMSQDSIKPSKITGLTMDLGDDANIPISEEFGLEGMNEAVKTATIKKGSLSFACALPTGWSGVSCTKSNFELSGGIVLPNASFADTSTSSDFLRKEASLDGLTVTPDPVSTTGSYVEIEIKDATVIFSDDASKVTLQGSCTIDEIDEIVINIGELETFEDDVDTDLNITEMLDFLDEDSDILDNVLFSGIESYVFITQPTENEILKGLSLSGTIYADYDDGPSEKTYLVGSSGENASLKMKTCDKTLATVAQNDDDGNPVITTDELFKEQATDDENFYSGKVNDGVLDELINKKPNNLKFHYKFTLSGNDGNDAITLSNDDIEALNSNKKLTVSLAIILPMQVILADVSDGTADETITIADVLALTGNEFTEDMLNRDEASDSEDWLDYTPIIDSVEMEYTIKNNTQLTSITMTFNDENSGINKDLEASEGTHKISFNQEEMESIFKNYPFVPTIQAKIGGADGTTSKKFPRNSSLDFNAKFKVKTNGTAIKVWDKND